MQNGVQKWDSRGFSMSLAKGWGVRAQRGPGEHLAEGGFCRAECFEEIPKVLTESKRVVGYSLV